MLYVRREFYYLKGREDDMEMGEVEVG